MNDMTPSELLDKAESLLVGDDVRESDSIRSLALISLAYVRLVQQRDSNTTA